MFTWLVRSAIAALYPRTDSLPGAEDCRLDEFLAQFKRETPFKIWLGVVAGAIVFHATPLFTIGIPAPAFLLTAKARDRHAAKVTGIGVYLLRQSIVLLKLAAGFCWGIDPKVRTLLALKPYPPDPTSWRST